MEEAVVGNGGGSTIESDVDSRDLLEIVRFAVGDFCVLPAGLVDSEGEDLVSKGLGQGEHLGGTVVKTDSLDICDEIEVLLVIILVSLGGGLQTGLGGGFGETGRLECLKLVSGVTIVELDVSNIGITGILLDSFDVGVEPEVLDLFVLLDLVVLEKVLSEVAINGKSDDTLLLNGDY